MKSLFQRTAWNIFLAALVLFSLGANAEDPNALRGERVGWARLKTASPDWRGHAQTDPRLMRFFREETTLNIDPTWYEADVEDLKEMCAYPLLFAQSIKPVTDRLGRNNIAEYIRRGGFLLIDACINPALRGNPDVFIAAQIGTVKGCLPEAEVKLLPNDHEIFHCLFKFRNGPPHTEDHEGWGTHGLYGIFLDKRLAGIISTSGLQCGWAGMKQVAGHDSRCMQMLVNIYVYAMLQQGDGRGCAAGTPRS